MQLIAQLRGFARAFRRGVGFRPDRHRGHAIAKTIKHGTTIVGNGNATLGNVGTQRREDLMVEASERYASSFDED